MTVFKKTKKHKLGWKNINYKLNISPKLRYTIQYISLVGDKFFFIKKVTKYKFFWHINTFMFIYILSEIIMDLLFKNADKTNLAVQRNKKS